MSDRYLLMQVPDASWLEVSLPTAASEVNFVETPSLGETEQDIRLGSSFSDPDVQTLFRPQPQNAAIRTYTIRDTVLDTDYMVLFQNGKIIPETVYMMNEENYVNAQFRQFRANVRQEQVLRLRNDRDYIIGCNRSHVNYYHWMIQALPSIDLSLRYCNRSRELAIILPQLKPWQAQTLELLGLDRVEQVRFGAEPFLYLPSALYSDFLNGTTAFAVSRSAMSTYRRLRNAAANSLPSPDIIYVARTDTQQRPMSNESDLIARLQREGVEIIVPGQLSVIDQISLFRGTRAVIAPHGAGLTNIIFCAPRTFLYELLPTFYANACFNRLAQAVGVRYRADLFPAAGDEPDGFARHWHVDVDVVMTQLQEIRSVLASEPRVETAMEYLTDPLILPRT